MKLESLIGEVRMGDPERPDDHQLVIRYVHGSRISAAKTFQSDKVRVHVTTTVPRSVTLTGSRQEISRLVHRVLPDEAPYLLNDMKSLRLSEVRMGDPEVPGDYVMTLKQLYLPDTHNAKGWFINELATEGWRAIKILSINPNGTSHYDVLVKGPRNQLEKLCFHVGVAAEHTDLRPWTGPRAVRA